MENEILHQINTFARMHEDTRKSNSQELDKTSLDAAVRLTSTYVFSRDGRNAQMDAALDIYEAGVKDHSDTMKCLGMSAAVKVANGDPMCIYDKLRPIIKQRAAA